ncbi:MAG: DUF6114 domain-containing protein [Halorientalis sp.]
MTGTQETADGATEETITFAEWRAARPFYGGLALIVGGLVVTWPSLQFLLQTTVLQSQSVVSLGVIVGALLVFLGLAAWLRPEHSMVIGVGGLVLATLSFPVAFGGLLVGMLVASAGGILCFAWQPPADNPLVSSE